MREYQAFNPNLFQPSGPTSVPGDDGLTMVMDPISQDDLRTDPPSEPITAVRVPLQPARSRITTPLRAALVGTALLAAALLVYVGRGYIQRPAELVEPAELTDSSELTALTEAEDTIAVIPLTSGLPSHASHTTPLAAPVAPVVVLLAPISDAAIPVTSASFPSTEQPVAELNNGPASSTDSSATGLPSEPSESTEENAAQPRSDAPTEPGADLPTPDTQATQAQATDDESPPASAAATDQVAAQSDPTTAADQATTEPTTATTEASSAAQHNGTTATTASSAARVDLGRSVNEQRDRGGADNQATSEGRKRASQVLGKLSQPIGSAGPDGGFFGQR